MSWFTVGEVVVWLVLAAALGGVLGWLLHEAWNRRFSSATAVDADSKAEPAGTAEPEPEPEKLIKGNAKSKIFHVPGSPAYERTRADQWFGTEAEAEAAGYRPPKSR